MKINSIIRTGPLVFIIAAFIIIPARAETITDDAGRKIDIKIPVASLISLSPAQTEIIYALGGGNKLKAVTVNCDYPADAMTKEKAGSFVSPDIEKIVSLKPDVVLAAGELQSKVIESLEKLHIKTVIFCPQNISEIKNDIRITGKLLGNEKKAGQIVSNIETAVSRPKPGRRLKIYVEIWGKPALTIGRGSFITDVISKAGGINIYGGHVSSYPKVSVEDVIKRNPDVILLLYTPETGYMKKSWFKLTNAGRLGNIFVIREKDMDVMLRPGPRILEAHGILTDIFSKIKTGG